VQPEGGSRAGSVQAARAGRTIGTAAMNVFISYSTKDRSTAAALYRDLRSGGATAFQFEQSETAGTPAWNQIVDWIRECDVFVVLISASALKSTAVAEEIEIAHYCYINSERKKPAKIIPAIVEAKVAPPPLIERMSSLDLMNYQTGLPKLLGQLGLKVASPALKSAAPVLPPIDWDRLAREYAKENPLSRKQKQVRSDVRNLLTNYQELKPAELPKETEAQHVDSLVADLMGKSPKRFADPKKVASANEAFLGVGEVDASALTKRLLDVDRSALKLPAPAVRRKGDTLTWQPVLGATAYVVERKSGNGSSEEVYRGNERSYYVPSISHLLSAATFRVKATAGVFGVDSPWSDTVEFAATQIFKPTKQPLAAQQLATMPGPKTLTVDRNLLQVHVGWTPVLGATSYVLERGRSSPANITPDRWNSVYEGQATEFMDKPIVLPMKGEINVYRVKALGFWGETQWRY
jgi:hypothetical protein